MINHKKQTSKDLASAEGEFHVTSQVKSFILISAVQTQVLIEAANF